jgi:hypothetical protein
LQLPRLVHTQRRRRRRDPCYLECFASAAAALSGEASAACASAVAAATRGPAAMAAVPLPTPALLHGLQWLLCVQPAPDCTSSRCDCMNRLGSRTLFHSSRPAVRCRLSALQLVGVRGTDARMPCKAQEEGANDQASDIEAPSFSMHSRALRAASAPAVML